ncbi:hypothetical protein ACJX0J_030383, partial [Zea mays]
KENIDADRKHRDQRFATFFFKCDFSLLLDPKSGYIRVGVFVLPKNVRASAWNFAMNHTKHLLWKAKMTEQMGTKGLHLGAKNGKLASQPIMVLVPSSRNEVILTCSTPESIDSHG